MMGSLYSSISGLRNHTTWMNTIGNNISNVNTVGYKMQRVTFKEQITQSLGAASSANAASNLGGINPTQMGLGASLGSIDTIMTQGAIQTTGNPLDVALTGEGFFTVMKGAQQYYTRAGNFLQDNLGNVVTSDGAIAQGWMGGLNRTLTDNPLYNPTLQISAANYEINTNDVSQIGNVQIPNDMRMSAQATRYVKFSGNLDSNTPINNYAWDPAAGAVPAANMVLPSNTSPNAYTAGQEQGLNVDIQQRALYDTALVPPAWTAAPQAWFHTNPADYNSAKIEPDHTATFEVYDSLGNPKSLTVWYFQTGVDTTGTGADFRPVWDWYAFDTTFDPNTWYLTGEPDFFNCVGGTNIYADSNGTVAATAANTYSPLWFNQDGSLASNGGSWDVGAGFSTQAIATNIDGQDIYGPMIYFEQQTHAQGIMPDGAMDLEFILHHGTPNSWDGAATAGGVLEVNSLNNTPVDPGAVGLRDGVTGDVSGDYQIIGGVQQYVPNNTAYSKEVDGWRSGDLIGLNVDSTGGIVGQFTNEKSITIAKLAIAQFANAQGLAKAGSNLYSTTSNSGTARLTEAGTAGAATTIGGSLEASNVDLSVELTNMIVAQRGFESNARIVTTSADMLDTLVNLGR